MSDKTATTTITAPPVCDIHGCQTPTDYSILVAAWASKDERGVIGGYCEEHIDEMCRVDGHHLIGEVEHE